MLILSLCRCLTFVVQDLEQRLCLNEDVRSTTLSNLLLTTNKCIRTRKQYMDSLRQYILVLLQLQSTPSHRSIVAYNPNDVLTTTPSVPPEDHNLICETVFNDRLPITPNVPPQIHNPSINQCQCSSKILNNHILLDTTVNWYYMSNLSRPLTLNNPNHHHIQTEELSVTVDEPSSSAS